MNYSKAEIHKAIISLGTRIGILRELALETPYPSHRSMYEEDVLKYEGRKQELIKMLDDLNKEQKPLTVIK